MAIIPIQFEDEDNDEQVERQTGVDLLASYFIVGGSDDNPVIVPKPNIADMFPEPVLRAVGAQAVEGFLADQDSMTEWSEFVDMGLKLVEQEKESRNTPWDGAANFKSPTLMNAGLKFSDRASTELLRGRNIVKTSIIGKDDQGLKADRADRVADFSNYQINEEMPEWRDEHEKLIYDLPYVGTVFKKTFFDAQEGRPVSNLVTFPNFAVNQDATSVFRLRRFTEIIDFSENEVIEKQRQGVWLDVELNLQSDSEGEEEQQAPNDNFSTYIEQQGFFDLDDDGYEEPYTYVVHVSTKTVVRITPRFEPEDVFIKDERNQRATTLDTLLIPGSELPKTTGEREVVRIKPINSITKYGFIRDPQGGFLDIGYFHLLSSLTAGINTTTNQLIDAGTLSNRQSGWLAKGFRAKMGNSSFKPGEWKQTGLAAQDMSNGIMPLPVKEPSATLFSLMQMMVASSQELSASADLKGALSANAPAATTLALVQEQQQSTGAIILRIYRSMAEEFKKLFVLNSKFLDPVEYQNVLDDPEANFEQDFNLRDMDVIPVANPEVSSKIQRIQQASVEISQLQNVLFAGGNPIPVVRNFFEVIGSNITDEVFPELDAQQRLQQLLSENPELMALITEETERLDLIAAAQADAVEREQMRQDAELASKLDKEASEVEKNQSATILNLEKAETEETKNQIDTYTAAGQIDQQALQNEQTLQQLQQPQELTNATDQTRPS